MERDQLAGCLDAALKYASLGWPVFPLWGNDGKKPVTDHGVLDATTDVNVIEAWWKKWPHANVGIACGQNSFDALDIDGPEGEKAIIAWLNAKGIFEEGRETLNSTLINVTAKGKHLCFKPTGKLKNAVRIAEFTDIKTDGGYIVAPPSVHRKTGTVYSWAPEHGPDDISPSPFPEWLLEYLSSRKTRGSRSLFSEEVIKVRAGERNSTLFRQAASARARGVGEKAILGLLKGINSEQCDPPLPDDEVERIAQSASIYPPGGAKDAIADTTLGCYQPFTLDDFGVKVPTKVKEVDPETGHVISKEGFKFAFMRHKAVDSILSKMNLAMTSSSKDVYCFDGEIFSSKGEAVIKDTIYSVCESNVHRSEASEVIDRIKSKLSIEPTDLTPEPYMMPLKNGVIDLRTGELLEYSPDHKFTFKYAAKWDPEGGNWRRVLWHLCSSLPDPRAVMQAIDIMTATAIRMPFAAWVLLIGGGNNGKGMFERLLLNFVTLDRASALTLDEMKKSHFASGHLLTADLLIISEVEDVKDVNSILKKIATGEFIDSDVKYGGRVKGSPHLMMVLDANNAFEYGDDSFGRKRRTIKQDWPYQFGDGPTERPIDRGIEELFKSGDILSGVAWIVSARAPSLLQTRKIYSYKSVDEMDAEFDRQRNSLHYFTEECLGGANESSRWLEVSDGFSDYHRKKLSTRAAYDLYLEWCGYFRVPTPGSHKHFTSYIKKKFGSDTTKTSGSIDGKKTDFRFFDSVGLVKTPAEAYADHILVYNPTVNGLESTPDTENSTALIPPFTACIREIIESSMCITAVTASTAEKMERIIGEIESMFSFIKSCENSPREILWDNYLKNSAVSAASGVTGAGQASCPKKCAVFTGVKDPHISRKAGQGYQTISENLKEAERRQAEKDEKFKTPGKA